jgi:K+-transporting ATPase KdpF subunit
MAVSRPEWANDGLVIENFVAAFVGLGLLIYLGYALARPDRF